MTSDKKTGSRPHLRIVTTLRRPRVENGTGRKSRTGERGSDNQAKQNMYDGIVSLTNCDKNWRELEGV